jgi:ketosteroid isomerase-like protein
MTSARRSDPLGLSTALYSALHRADVPALRFLLDPHFRARLTPGLPWHLGRRPLEGAEAMLRDGWGVVFRELDVRPIPEQSYVVDDVVVVQGTYRGRARATGRPIDAWFVHIWRVRGARFVELRQVTDTAAWWDALETSGGVLDS